MTQIQNDLLEIYNNLVVFSDTTVGSNMPLPIVVWYEADSRLLAFEQKGKSVRITLPTYYCLGLESIVKPTYLIPSDYDYLMSTLQALIGSGELLKPRVCISPENYGFDVYNVNIKELWKGPGIIGQVRFVSGTSWFFKYRVRKKYKL